jgi:hypothetical protein
VPSDAGFLATTISGGGFSIYGKIKLWELFPEPRRTDRTPEEIENQRIIENERTGIPLQIRTG